jgi:hypothetical protein
MPTVGDVYELAMHFLVDGEEDCYNIFNYAVTNGNCTDAELLTALASAMTTAYGFLLAQVSNNVNAQTSKVTKIIWTGVKWQTQTIVGTILPSIAFANTGDTLPYQIAALVKFPTIFPRVVGKKYLPPFGEDRQADSVLVGSDLVSCVNFGDAIRTVLTPGSATVNYVVATKDGGYVGPLATVAEGILSNQKRRKIGVGS